MRTRRAFFCLLVLLCSLLFTGCDESGLSSLSSRQTAAVPPACASDPPPVSSSGVAAVSQIPLAGSPFPAVQTRFGFQSLQTDLQRTCYEKMEQAAYRVSSRKGESGYAVDRFSVYGELPEAEIRLVLAAFAEDHPEIFWLQGSFSYTHAFGRTVLDLTSLFSPEECLSMQAEMNRAVERLFGGITLQMDGFERELYLHDALLANCEYADRELDSENAGEGEYPLIYTAYGALVNGRAVCEGYAGAMRLLLRGAGIPVRKVSGRSEGELHAWNAVQLGGEWYHLDPTWNDTEYGTVYQYFNLSDQQILQDHTISPDYRGLTEEELCGKADTPPASFNLSLPACTGESQNYFIRRGILITGMDASSDQAVVAQIVEKIQRGETVLCFRAGDSMDYGKTMDMMLRQQPYKLLYYLKQANRELPPPLRKDLDQVRYLEFENHRSVLVY